MPRARGPLTSADALRSLPMDDLELRQRLRQDLVPASRGSVRTGHALFRHAFVPLLLTVTIGGWCYRDVGERLLSGWSLGIDYVTCALLTGIVVIWCAEQLYPADPEWNYRLLSSGARGWNRFARDFFYLVFVTLLSAVLIKLTASRVHGLLAGLRLPSLWPTRAAWPLRIALAFFGVELCSYGFHRAAHRIPLLWQFHSTHHVVTELGGLKSLRTHPVDNVLFYVVRTVPLMLLGAGAGELLAATYLGAVLGLLAHANIRVAAGPLGLVVNFPQYHQVHHSADLGESNSNFGCHTVLWDRVFGTFRAQAAGPLRIGVHPIRARSLWQELAWPFYRTVALEPERKESPPPA